MQPLLRAVLLALGLARPDPPPPSPSDLDWFPPTECVQQALAFQAEHVEWVRCQVALHPGDPAWVDWLAEAEAEDLAEVWGLLAQAQDPELACDGGQLDYLEALRDRLGARSYAAGRMPPAVPRHRFARLP